MTSHSTHSAFMREAFAVARRSFATGGGPFGAVIVLNDQIVGSGMSLAHALHDPTAHAEVLAIRAAAQTLKRIDLSDCVAYSSAEPCPMCLSAFYWSRIPIVYYGASSRDTVAFGYEDLYIYEQLSSPSDSRSVVCHPLLQDQALKLLTEADHRRPYDSFLPTGWKPR